MATPSPDVQPPAAPPADPFARHLARLSSPVGPGTRLFQGVSTVVRWIGRLLFRFEIIGAEHIPTGGPMLVAPTHTSYLDPPLVGSNLGRGSCFIARENLTNFPLLGAIPRSLNAFPVRRGAGDREAIRACRAILKAGHSLVFFPEGTRSRTGTLGPIQGGFAMVLDGLDVPYLPVQIQDTFRALPRGALLPRPVKVRMVVGAPRHLPARAEGERTRDYYVRCAADLEASWRALGAK